MKCEWPSCKVLFAQVENFKIQDIKIDFCDRAIKKHFKMSAASDF